MDNIVDIDKNKVPKTKELEQIFIRSCCCTAPWELTRLNGIWKVICNVGR